MIGGGSLPGEGLPTFVLAIPHPEPHRLAASLRAAETPVVGRVEHESLLLDPRTVAESEEPGMLAALRAAPA